MAVISLLWKSIKFIFVAFFFIFVFYVLISFVNYKNEAEAWTGTAPTCSYPTTENEYNYSEDVYTTYVSWYNEGAWSDIWGITDENYSVYPTFSENTNILVFMGNDGDLYYVVAFPNSTEYPEYNDRQFMFMERPGFPSENIMGVWTFPTYGVRLVIKVDIEEEETTLAGAWGFSTNSTINHPDEGISMYVHGLTESSGSNIDCIVATNPYYESSYDEDEFEEFNPESEEEYWNEEDCGSLDVACWFGGFLENVAEEFVDLFTAIVDFFKWLFIPSEDLMSGIFDELSTAINDQLGLLLYPFEFIADILTAFTACGNFESTCDVPPGLTGNFMGQDWYFITPGEDQSVFQTPGGSSASEAYDFADWITNLVRVIIVGLLIAGYHHLFIRVFRT